MLLVVDHRGARTELHKLLEVHPVKRSRFTIVLVALIAIILGAPAAAWAYTSTQFAYNVTLCNGCSVTSPLGSHFGGQAHSIPVGGTATVYLLQGHAVISQASGGAPAYVQLGPYGSAWGNSRIQCRWTHPYGYQGGMDCWRWTP